MQTMSRIVISTSTDIIISLVVSFLCNHPSELSTHLSPGKYVV